MSLFGSMLHDFRDDQFFSIHNKQMDRVDRMMDNFMSPLDMLGGFGFPQLMGSQAPPANRRSPQRQTAANHAAVPFGFGRSMLFPNVGEIFAGVERMSNDPNCTMYSSSSVVSYSMGDDGQPKVYHASSTTRTAPGGVKETRRAMSDSTTGVQKMAIGHHLGERAHIVEKSKNKRTGEQDDSEEYINIGEGEEEHFNQEWCQRTSHSKFRQPQNRQSVAQRPQVANQPLAIAAGPSHDTSHHGRKRDQDSNGRAAGSRHSSTEKSRATNENKQRRDSKS